MQRRSSGTGCVHPIFREQALFIRHAEKDGAIKSVDIRKQARIQ